MQKKTNWLAVFAVVMTCLFVVAGAVALFNEKEVIPTGYVSDVDLQTAVDTAKEPLQNQINELTEQLSEKTEEMIEKVAGYFIDELHLGVAFGIDDLSDREVKTLFDGEVSFGDKEIDAEEIIQVNGKMLANEDDFKGVPYMVFDEGEIVYKIVFDDDLNISEIDDDENILEFNLLGKEVKIVEWEDDRIMLFEGDTYYLDEGVAQTINDKEVELVFANDDSALFRVGDDTKEIKEGFKKTIGDFEIKLEYVFETTDFRIGQAKVVIGEEVEKEIFNTDDYNDDEDSIWEYYVNGNLREIGIKLSEHFDDLDDENKPLAVGEFLCLPNEYLCLEFNEFVEEDVENYRFTLDDGLIEVRGNFQSGLEDYDKLFIDTSDGLIYSDDDLELEDKLTEDVFFGESEKKLDTSIVGKIFTFTGVKFKYNSTDLFELQVDGTSISSEEDNYRSDYGALVFNPEDNLEDGVVDISIPEEKVEGTLRVY